MILALDFDGVLHPVRTTTEPKFCRLELLESWLRVRPGLNLVISSSWREAHPFDLLRSFFGEDLQARVLGVTPNSKVILGPAMTASYAERAATIGQRQCEIEQWIAESGAPRQSWVALDDDPSLFKLDCKTLVVCDPTVGLTQHQLDQLDTLGCREPDFPV